MPGFDFCAESVFPRATVYIVNNYMKALSYLQRANVLVNVNSSSHQPCIFFCITPERGELERNWLTHLCLEK